MFTGIIEDIGSVVKTGTSVLAVGTRLDGIKPGDSVAVNGICLTATLIRERSGGPGATVDFDFSPETADRTNLGLLKPGAKVNLERALRVGDRLGGHFLSGHVENTGRVAAVRAEGNAQMFSFEAPEDMVRYLAPKGSVGIDGISLTVAAREGNVFTVAVIPHSLAHTTLVERRPGDIVNLEPDILAKYIENILNSRDTKPSLTRNFLAENGFM